PETDRPPAPAPQRRAAQPGQPPRQSVLSVSCVSLVRWAGSAMRGRPPIVPPSVARHPAVRRSSIPLWKRCDPGRAACGMVDDGRSGVEFRLLGPVEVWIDGRRVDAGQPRQRAALAALLVDAGRVVPIETLIDRVWGQVVPEHARATLRTHLSRIRRLLEQA